MTSLSLHRERFQAEQAPARSPWFVAASSLELARGAEQPGSLADRLVSCAPSALGYAPCFGTRMGSDVTTKINPEVDR